MSIPIIDLAASDDAEGVSRAIRTACEEIGFFIIVGHGVDADVLARASAEGTAFFDLPVPEKSAFELGDGAGLVLDGLRYNGLEKEALAASLGEQTPADLKESIGFGPVDLGRPWPAGRPGLERSLRAYFAELLVLADRLRGLLLTALGEPADALDEHFPEGGGASYLRVLNYPERAGALPGQMRAGAHTDYDCITILRSQDSAGGLQVQARDGAWHDVQGIDDAFVVNIGDAMNIWSNDRFVSTLHRVVTPPDAQVAGSRRQSLAFFYSPTNETVIEPLLRPGETAVREATRFDQLQDAKASLAHGVATP